jgi:hypothetical protein
MKKMPMLLFIGLVITFVGCDIIASKEIVKQSLSERTGVFYEIQGEETPQKGLVDLTVKAQIKTHPEGWYFLESKNSLHGKSRYPFLFNIDGQAIIWEAPGKKENDHKCNSKENIPDCGEGVKYILEKTIRLKEGVHRVFFGLPGDDYRIKFEITCKEGEPCNLELKPIYRRYQSASQNYLKGIIGFKVFLNNERIPEK